MAFVRWTVAWLLVAVPVTAIGSAIGWLLLLRSQPNNTIAGSLIGCGAALIAMGVAYRIAGFPQDWED